MALPPPGWSYNPSSWSDRAWIIAVAAIGFVISGYLALYQWNVIGAVWEPFLGREANGPSTRFSLVFCRFLMRLSLADELA